jgi:hypothetical protein
MIGAKPFIVIKEQAEFPHCFDEILVFSMCITVYAE